MSGQSWYELPLIAPPTIHENQAPLDVGSELTGKFVKDHNQMTQRYDQRMWEIQLQFIGNGDYALENSFNALWGDSGGLPQLKCDTTPVPLTHNAQQSHNGSKVIYIGGANYDSTYNDQKYIGCICKSVELTHSLDSNGGLPVITATYVTGYQHSNSNDVTAGSGSSIS